MKLEIQAQARQLGGFAVYQGKSKTFFVYGEGIITKLKNQYSRFGFSFEKGKLFYKNAL